MKNMKKHEVGDKFVIEIDKVFGQDGDTLYRVKGMKSLVFDEYGLNILEPLSAYTDPLETKTRRQASHITYLEGKINELKSDLKHGRTTEDDRDPEAERAAGQQEAWELAQKIISDDGYSGSELKEIFGNQIVSWCISSNTYTEAAAKVAEWEWKKEEICVGDVLLSKTIREKCIVTSFAKLENTACILWNDGLSRRIDTNKLKEEFEKIGHIDVNAWLAQIGGESE